MTAAIQDVGLLRLRTARRHAETLRRRREFVLARLAEKVESRGADFEPATTFEHAEAEAIRFALDLVENEWDNLARLWRNVRVAENRLKYDVDDRHPAPPWRLANEEGEPS